MAQHARHTTREADAGKMPDARQGSRRSARGAGEVGGAVWGGDRDGASGASRITRRHQAAPSAEAAPWDAAHERRAAPARQGSSARQATPARATSHARQTPSARRAAPANAARGRRVSSSRQTPSARQATSVRTASRGNYALLLSAVAIAAIVVLLAVFLVMRGGVGGIGSKAGAGAGEGGDAGQDSQAALDAESTSYVYESPYDWTKLDRTDGRFAYIDNGQTLSRLGVDVSENQGYIDWWAVAEDGIDFAMIRQGYRGATEGELYTDAYFEYNIEAAREAGIDCGLYFFSQAITVEEAVEEAEYVLDSLGEMPLEYPIAFDSEVVSVEGARTAAVSGDQMTAIADAFCDRIREAGYEAFVYGNYIDLGRYSRQLVDDEQIWWAEYNTPAPAARIDIVMWQYSNGGSVAGIDAAVDMNIDLSGCAGR